MSAVFIPTDDGRWVNADFERLARNIKGYDPNLELRWIPPDKRTREDGKPYIVVDTLTGKSVLHAGELDTPAEILSRLYTADGSKGDILSKLEAYNLAVENLKIQEQLDEREAMKDEALFLIRSPRNYLKFNGKKLDEWRRPIL